MTRTKKITAAEQYFAEYKEYVIDLFFDDDVKRRLPSPSYSTRESLQNWQTILPYSDALMDRMVLECERFMRKMDRRDSRATCPHLLFALTAKMAKYLSEYKMRGHPRILSGEKLSEKALNKIQAKAIAELKEKLDKCDYITKLFAKQAQKREERAKGKHARKQAGKRRHEEQAQASYNMARQVRAEFNAMQHIPRKMR